MAGGKSTVAVTRPVWSGTVHGWLLPPDVVELPDEIAEQVLAVDPDARLEAPAPVVAPVKRGPGRPRKNPVEG